MTPTTGQAGSLPYSFRASISHGALWAVSTLLVGLTVTGIVAYDQMREAEEAAKRAFFFVCSEVGLRVEARLQEHEQILRSGVAFFSDEDGVDRKEWLEFAERQKLGQKLPGIQGIGFSRFVPKEEVGQLVARVHADGYPEFRVWPEGERDFYSTIIYLEPLSGRNLRAFGYDMLTEPVRRAAMERARDRDEVALSAKVALVQENGSDVQAGTLMYAPVYRMGSPHATVEERRASLLGWVYSPYRMNDLMEGILGNRAKREHVDLKIYDGGSESPDALLYDSGHDAPAGRADAPGGKLLAQRLEIEAAGHKWLLSFSQACNADFSMAWMVVGGGTALSALLSALVYSLSRTGSQARKLAARLTAELSESEMRCRAAIEGTGDGHFDWDVQSGRGFYSRRWKEMLGHTDKEIGPDIGEWETRIHPDDKERVSAAVQNLLENSVQVYSQEHRMRCKDGTWKWILARATVIRRDASGKPLRVVGTHSDITEKRQMAEIKSRLISMASHEFRTPLATIRIAADLLSTCRDRMGEGDVQKSLRTILRTADYMTEIVTDVLDLSAMTRDDRGEVLSEVQIGGLLRTTVDEFHASKPSHNAVTFEWDGVPVVCLGVPALLKRAVINLLDNAVKYSSPGEPVVLRLTREDGDAVIDVEDRGIGIPEEELALVRDAFFRASNTAGIPGTGLGLAIVAEAMQRIGGKIECAKRSGGGTIFTLRLPLAATVNGASGANMP